MTLGVNESAKPRLHPQRHASQELLSSRQTLLRERISQQDQVYIIQNANQELSNSCQTLLRERTCQQNHDYILQRHENQELSNSCQTLLRERTSQQNHDYILQRHDINQKLSNSCHTLLRERMSQQRPLLHHSNMQTFGPMPNLAEGNRKSARPTTTSFKTCKSRALRLLPKS